MNIRFSLLDLDINTNLNTYGLFLGNWMTIDKTGRVASEDKSVLRVEYSVITGWELEVFGFIIL
jgi:hypothetical protein